MDAEQEKIVLERMKKGKSQLKIFMIVMLGISAAAYFYFDEFAGLICGIITGLISLFIFALLSYGEKNPAYMQKRIVQQKENQQPDMVKKRLIIVAIILPIVAVILYISDQKYEALGVFIGSIGAIVYALRINKFQKNIGAQRKF